MPGLWSFILSLTFAFLPLVSAHTQIWYPEWRANSFLSPYSQTMYPCAGISDNSTTTRTLWPLDGGSLNVTLHDAAAYIFINIGLGVNVTNFNYTLFNAPLNETGAGNLCFPKLSLPPNLPIVEGTQASIQFATAGHNGEGLYNCADITFSSNATLLPSSQCVNTTVTISPLGSGTVASADSTSTSSGSTSSSSSTSKSGAVDFVPPMLGLLLTGLCTAILSAN
ncbi:hypothetical protein B7494_g2396 [Chlorociboria aeruginascens]|nr:hypothetical protein B7494_g2396 [Chlorociboria aeruginascens]